MESSDAEISGLLSDVRVVSFGSFLAGNTAALVLAELGADVVKIEPRLRPEALRSYYTPDHGSVYEPSGIQTTALFAGRARSTRSASVDPDTEAGRQLLGRLVGEADVLIENVGPRKMAQWGLSDDTITANYPALIVASISGYGRTGPRAGYRSYGSSISAYLGLTKAWHSDVSHFDHIAAYQAANATVAALWHRRRTGVGLHIDIAQAEAGAAIMTPLYLDALNGGEPWTQPPNEVPGAVLSTVVACAGDDRWAAIELEDVADWNTLCQVLERVDLRLGDGERPDQRGTAPLRHALERWASTLTPHQVALKLQHAGLAAAPVANTEDLWRDPQMRSRGGYVEIDHPDLGTIEYPQSPDRAELTPGRVRRPGPRLGEHSSAVVTEWLGLSRSEVDHLVDQGALWQPPLEPSPIGDSP